MLESTKIIDLMNLRPLCNVFIESKNVFTESKKALFLNSGFGFLVLFY